jgi:hypothetical protein
MSIRHSAGRATGAVVLLLVLLSGLGAWNYHRNWQLEKQTEQNRPYKNYAVADLEKLRAAYQAELKGVRAEFDSARRNRARPARDAGSIAANVAQFSRTARASDAIRDAAANVADREGQIEQLTRELDLRAQLGEGLMVHFKRLTTI